jgi:hypothetical protein
MDIDKLVKDKMDALSDKRIVSFTKNELDELRTDEAEYFIKAMEKNILMEMPDDEIAFFEWLKKSDKKVWTDLWGEEVDVYYVSLELLSQFVGNSNGFPICDLVEQPNFWFVVEHIKPKGMKQMDGIFEKMESGKALERSELFLAEISQASMDIWHFAYKYEVAIDEVKAMIDEMVYNGWIVHLPEREDLVKYVEI